MNNWRISGNMKLMVMRIMPQAELRREICEAVQKDKIRGAVILSCAGSLTGVKLRCADRSDGKLGEQRVNMCAYSLFSYREPNDLLLFFGCPEINENWVQASFKINIA